MTNVDSFASLPGFQAYPEFLSAAEHDGIETPTEPQSLAFEPILRGGHVLVDSGTGTGKTLAYLLPLLHVLSKRPEARVVCLAPSAELAIQTLNVIERYKPESLSVGALVGGGNQNKQRSRIQKSTRLIVGTPGRVLEMISARKLKGISTFVLDEPEPILGFKDAGFLLEVISRPPRPQVILAGATFGRSSQSLADRLKSENIERIVCEAKPLQANITHHKLRVQDAAARDLQLARFLGQAAGQQTVVYVNESYLIRHLFRYLVDNGFTTVTVSQDRTKQQCKRALADFNAGQAQVLLATDAAATGIDLKQIPWVVQYEPPRSTQAYVHRAGRTGRAGGSGQSLLMLSEAEHFISKKLEKELDITFNNFRV